MKIYSPYLLKKTVIDCAVGVICYVLLTGLSPFMGETDVDTFTSITRADYDFDDDAFDAVSEEARDFIASLLLHRKEDRLTTKECLDSKWLSQQHHDVMGSTKLCTDKLKKFIIRRKWQVIGDFMKIQCMLCALIFLLLFFLCVFCAKLKFCLYRKLEMP